MAACSPCRWTTTTPAPPFYSEAEQDFGGVQDWTSGGVDTLVLYVRGRLVNSVAPLYVAD